MSKYNREEKLKILAYALATSYGKASEKFGPSKSTISRWRKELDDPDPANYDFDFPEQENGTERQNGTERENEITSQKVKEMSEEAVEDAKADVKERLVEDIEQLSEKMINTAEDAVTEVKELIQQGKTEKEYSYQWLKAVVGAMDYLVKNAQFLKGNGEKPGDVNVNVTNKNVQQKTEVNVPDNLREAREFLFGRLDTTAGSEGTGEADTESFRNNRINS